MSQIPNSSHKVMLARMPVNTPYAMEYVRGMSTIVRKEGKAILKLSQLMSRAWPISMVPTTTRAGPVAYLGGQQQCSSNGPSLLLDLDVKGNAMNCRDHRGHVAVPPTSLMT